MNKKSLKEQHLFGIKIFCDIAYFFTLIFYQFKLYLEYLNNSTNITEPKR